MPYQQSGQQKRPKSGYGTLKKNKSDNPHAPVLKGGCTVDGVEHWVSMFRSRKNPGDYDLSFESKQEQRRESYDRAQAPQERYPDQDEF